jgi:membrane protein insertase Oxa1/YidC/SpoIIIJ
MGPLEYLLSPPVLYLLIVWGIATIIFIALMIWRSLLSSHEDDQIFLNPAEEMMEKEQRELVGKINKLSMPVMTSGIASGVLLLVMAVMVVYHGLKSF